MSQLVLPLRLADHAVFASFLHDGNETLVATLAGIAAGEGGQGLLAYPFLLGKRVGALLRGLLGRRRAILSFV